MPEMAIEHSLENTGTLAIKEVNHVVIEGTTGNEIIFVNNDHNNEKDERARGLKAVNALGIEDTDDVIADLDQALAAV